MSADQSTRMIRLPRCGSPSGGGACRTVTMVGPCRTVRPLTWTIPSFVDEHPSGTIAPGILQVFFALEEPLDRADGPFVEVEEAPVADPVTLGADRVERELVIGPVGMRRIGEARSPDDRPSLRSPAEDRPSHQGRWSDVSPRSFEPASLDRVCPSRPRRLWDRRRVSRGPPVPPSPARFDRGGEGRQRAGIDQESEVRAIPLQPGSPVRRISGHP